MGADICGFGAAEAFSGAPEGKRPKDLFPAAQSVIAFGIALPKGLMDVSPRILYNHFNGLAPDMLDRIGYRLALYLERSYGALAVPVPSDAPVDDYDPATLTARGLISMKHAAALCSLGQPGKNTLLLNSVYGNRLTLGLVLTDLAIPADPPAENCCIPGCRRCLDACPVHALDGATVNQTLCRPNTYGTNARGCPVCTCNACRRACPLRYGK